jgi:Bacteriophage HK97-gp10, putative tail-component
MSARVTWLGLEELKAALQQLPADLTELAGAIVAEAADGAAEEIRAAYPEGETGNLRRGVRVKTLATGAFSVARVVRSTAPHAHLFETGTQTRQTALGYHRGFMPGANIFVPVVSRRRRAMLEDLVAIVEQAGLDVRR